MNWILISYINYFVFNNDFRISINVDIINYLLIALLTLLIPLGVAIVQESLRVKNSDPIILPVVIDEVINFKGLLTAIFCIVIPLFFINKFGLYFQIIILIIIVFNFGVVAKIFSNIYNFLTGKKEIYIENYTKKELSYDKMFNLWQSIESKTVTNFQIDNKFSNIFLEKINYYIKNKHFKIANKLLDILLNNIDRRLFFFLYIDEKFFNTLLFWYKEIFIIEKESRDKHDAKYWNEVNSVLRLIEQIIKVYLKKSIKDKQGYYFFDRIKKYIEENKSNLKYTEHILHVFIPTFFENATEDTWEDFPKEWKTLSENIKHHANINDKVRIMVLNIYMDWFPMRYINTKKYDQELDITTYNLFLNTEHITWSNILLFMAYDISNLKAIIEREIIFGGYGRLRTYYSNKLINDEEFKKESKEAWKTQYQNQLRETFRLSEILFQDRFSEEKVDLYLKKVEKMIKDSMYKQDSSEYSKLRRLEIVFRDAKEYFKNKNLK